MSQEKQAPNISTEEIARRAYSLWEQSGYQHGQDREHWLAAEQQLLSELNQAPDASGQRIANDDNVVAEALQRLEQDGGIALDLTGAPIRIPSLLSLDEPVAPFRFGGLKTLLSLQDCCTGEDGTEPCILTPDEDKS